MALTENIPSWKEIMDERAGRRGLGHDPRSEFEQALEDNGWELRWYRRGIVLNEEPAFKVFCETGELEVGVA